MIAGDDTLNDSEDNTSLKVIWLAELLFHSEYLIKAKYFHRLPLTRAVKHDALIFRLLLVSLDLQW